MLRETPGQRHSFADDFIPLYYSPQLL